MNARMLTTTGLAIALTMLCLNAAAWAADKADVTGTWKWTSTMGGQSRESTIKLKQEGDKVTGVYVGRTAETAIKDGSFKDGTVTFKVTRKGQNGEDMTSTYTGKLEGDTIKGKIEREGAQARDWEAKRAKE